MIHSLARAGYTINVSSAGAELTRLEKKGVNYLWTCSAPFWQRHAPVLFPIVGKLKNNTYNYKGKAFHLPQHGFARDGEFELMEHSVSHLLFRLKENKHPDYPFAFNFSIRYTIEEKGVVTDYSVENTGDIPMPFSVGAHPGFLCPINEDEKLEDYSFGFDGDEVLKVIPLEGGLLTNREKLVPLKHGQLSLSEALFQNDALVIHDLKSRSVSLKGKHHSLLVSWNDCTYLGLWKQPKAPFVCIEPWWGVADRVSHNGNIEEKEGIMILAPGARRSFTYAIAIDQPA
jgi:galactose mutarotase-like enzyme